MTPRSRAGGSRANGCVRYSSNGDAGAEYEPKHYARDGVRRHVWIYGGQGPWPGLLVEWQRREEEWWARVISVPHPAEPGEFGSAWIPSSALRVAQDPYPPDRQPGST